MRKKLLLLHFFSTFLNPQRATLTYSAMVNFYGFFSVLNPLINTLSVSLFSKVEEVVVPRLPVRHIMPSLSGIFRCFWYFRLWKIFYFELLQISPRCKYCFFTAKHNQQMLDTHIQSMHKGGKVGDMILLLKNHHCHYLIISSNKMPLSSCLIIITATIITMNSWILIVIAICFF